MHPGSPPVGGAPGEARRETARGSGDKLVDTFGITPAMTVLDLGCGDGTTALPASSRGATDPTLVA
jgi:cyclopropane fatty-acyl-phospholipid synthase-like methyltransferase